MTKILTAFVTAALLAYFLGVVFISQGNIASVVELGFEVTLSQRLQAIVHDATHMLAIYLPLIAASLLIGLPVAYGIVRNKPQLRMFGYTLAGCLALLAMHLLMKAILGLSGIAATRSILGLLAQGLAGAAAGCVFCKLTQASVSDSVIPFGAQEDQ